MDFSISTSKIKRIPMRFLLRALFTAGLFSGVVHLATAQAVDDASLSWSAPVRLDVDRPLYDHCLVLHNGTLYGVSLTYTDVPESKGLVAYRNLETFHFTEEPVVKNENAHTRCWIEPPATLYVVWPKEDAMDDPGGRLYARSFDFESETWSPLEQVYGDDRGYEKLSWYSHSTSIIPLEEGGAVVAFSNDGRMHLLSREEDTWTVRDTALRATYTAVARAPNGHICEGFIAFARDYITTPPMSQKPSVLFMCSEDDGTLWKEPVLVHPSADTHRASALRIAVSSQGRIHLLWAVQLRQNGDFFQDDEFWHVYSDDGGRYWSTPSRIPIPSEVWLRSSEQLMALPDGTLHFVFDGVHRSAAATQLTTMVYHMWWDGALWAGPHPLPLKAWSQDPAIVLDASGHLLLLWTQHAEKPLLQGSAASWAPPGPGSFYTILERP